MYTLTTEEKFASAHQLRGYKGKCENIHGHTWKVELSVAGDELDAIGLLIDFQELKSILREITSMLDHKNINEVAPFNIINPSSENLAKFFYEEAEKRLRAKSPGIQVASTTVWESEISRCTYTR